MTSIADATEQFLRACRAERDLSPHTLAAYRRDLEQFADWAARGNVSTIEGIDRTLLRRYVAFLGARRLARRSIRRKVSALRSLLAWAVTNELLESSPAGDLQLPKLDRP